MNANPNLPRGLQAFLFDAAARRRAAEEAVARKLTAAGYREVLLPVLDYAAPYDGVTAEGDERLYRFVDRDGELLALRADFTPMAARVVAPRLAGLSGGEPVSLSYRGDVVRDEPTGVGRPREFAQAGAERYGDPSFEADEALLALALSCVVEVGGERLTVTLGYAGLLAALLAAAAPTLTVRTGRALDDALAAARGRRATAVEALLLRSGAASGAAAEIARSLLEGFDVESAIFAAPIFSGPVARLRRAAARARAEAPGVKVVVDLAGTPTAPYYTGLTFGIDAEGCAAPLAAGGRYDDLLARFGAPAPAVGFSIGLEALTASLAAADGGAAASAPARSLRIAAGKGRLLGRTLAALRDAGVDFGEPDGRRLLVPDRSGAFELLLLKDDDVPTYVAHGGADLGVVGSDRVAESGESVYVPVELPFGACRLSLIGRAGEPFQPNGHPVRVGTKYRRLAERYFDERKLAHEVVPLAGSVELAAALRLTDVVVDLIETGATMAAHGLAEIETILESRAVLVVGRAALVSRRAEIAALVSRLRTAGGAR